MTQSDFPNFSEYCEKACRKAWGKPTRDSKKELRWTNGDAYGGRTYSKTKKVWYDKDAKVGGSTLDLVAHSKGEPIEKISGAEFFDVWREAHKLGYVPDPPPPQKERLPIRRTYGYHDENGELLFQVVRFDTEDKDRRFRQRRPDGKGEWIWKKSERQVLYHLPELIEGIGNDRPVLVCEGEHDADTACGLGYVATTPPGGAEKPWRTEYSETLRGADVIVVADNDDRGKRHADNVARALQGVAKRVRVIMFPVKDLSEWIAAGHTREELDALIDATPDYAAAQPSASANVAISLEDFVAYMPAHGYIFKPTREMWPASSVNARIPPVNKKTAANVWLDANQSVEQMTWSPGEPMLIQNRLVAEGGWIERAGVTCFNLYRPPTIKTGDAAKAGQWLDHVKLVFPDDADHLVKWLAHRVQHPEVKINHGLVLGGNQGIGKDTLLEPVKHAIGPWNFAEVTPQHMLGRFNGFIKSVILRISEARDLGDLNRFAFYDHMKAYTAAPPDVLRCDEKNLREYSVFNVCGVIITTNHKADGIFLPADDRRHYVAWSDLKKESIADDYWNKLWGFYAAGGTWHICMDRPCGASQM